MSPGEGTSPAMLAQLAPPDARQAISSVVGYVRSDRPDGAKLDEPVKQVTYFAAIHGLALRCIYREDGPAVNQRAPRTAFAALLADLQQGHAKAVIVPTRRHLSWHPEVLATLSVLIAECGGRVFAADECTNPTCSDLTRTP